MPTYSLTANGQIKSVTVTEDTTLLGNPRNLEPDWH